MLTRLLIQNFILIEQLDLTFQNGLTVLTGETGAGKSILLDALDGVLGGKLSATMIRVGASKALLEAHFLASPQVQEWLATQELDSSEEIVISREVNARSSRYRLNGLLVNQALVLQLRDLLLDITAQGQSLGLSQPEVQRGLLDRFCHAELLVKSVQRAYRTWAYSQDQLIQAQAQKQVEKSQKELLRQQYQELKQAQISNPLEEEELMAEQTRLAHTVELTEHGQTVYDQLYRGSGSVADQLTQVQRLLDQMTAHDPQVGLIRELLAPALVQVEEGARQMRDYCDRLESDPDRITVIDRRLRLLRKICQKYGPTLEDVLKFQQQIQQQWQQLKTGAVSIEDLQAQVDQEFQALTVACQILSEARCAGAKQLQTQLTQALAPLGLAKATFVVGLEPIPPSPEGQEKVNFLWTANPGQPLASLKSTASGGEMARFLLALKATLGEAVPTLIFDEIDMGVSGKVAQAVAIHLMGLAQGHQVLCVTHQPLIAAMAQVHWRVRKSVSQNQTQVHVDDLDQLGQRTEELAQLAGGNSAQQARAFVAALLEEAQQLQKQIAILK